MTYQPLSAATRVSLVAIVLTACSTPTPTEQIPPLDAGTASDGTTDVAFDTPQTPEVAVADVLAREVATRDTACASIAAMASVVQRPLDVIVVVDASPSFDRPRAAITSTLAPSLIRALEAASVDYRVIVLGGMIEAPAMNPRFSQMAESVGSTGLLPSMPGFLRRALPMLRRDSLKALVDFTDDGHLPTGSVLGTRAEFYAGMAATGLAPNTPSSTPWPPTAPTVTTTCTGFSANPAIEMQELSRETGGYRFPLCNFAEYSNLFAAIAAQTISNVRVPCDFGVPRLSDGRTPDIRYARVHLTESDGMTTTRAPVADRAACGEGFYLVRGAAGDAGADAGPSADLVRLCPATCARVQADTNARVSFTFECPPG
jgi:hypothetical protein